MKEFNTLLAVLLLLGSCKQQNSQPAPAGQEAAEAAFVAVGDPIAAGQVQGQDAMALAYGDLQPGDTLLTRFEGEVLSVCQNKGCWMRLALPEDRTVMVRFKDYGFFVPKDIAGKKVVVEGKAFVSEVDEAERRHMAEDAGKPDSLIALIKGSERELGFEASGVRIY